MATYSKINMLAGLFTAFAHESITVTSATKSLTSTSYKDSDGNVAKRAVITIENAQIRYRYDGGDPTSTSHLANPMDVILLIGQINIVNFKVIRAGSTNAAIRITYER